MSKISDYMKIGVPEVVNSMNEIRRTREGNVVFPNGWVASIINPTDALNKYSVAVCDYNGYFDWNILNSEFETDFGAVSCDTEDEVCKVLEFIKNL